MGVLAMRRSVVALAVGLAVAAGAVAQPRRKPLKRNAPRPATPAVLRFQDLRDGLEDLTETFGDEYPDGKKHLARLDALERRAASTPKSQHARLAGELDALRREALLAHPLLRGERLLVLKRKRGQLGLPTNHQCNTALKQKGYDNEIAVLAPPRPGGTLTTRFRPKDGAYVGEIDLHWDARRLLFTMPNGRTWQIHELDLDTGRARQVSREDRGVDNFDAGYLPDGGIAFVSTACYTGVPCWHGQQRACAIYRMAADGSNMRQLCFDQDLDLHPSVLSNGQVVFNRWDYTGPLHMYLAPLMTMNPDGSNQRAIYGSNSYWPNRLYFPRAVPGRPGLLIAIAAGYHGFNRAGISVLLDTNRGGFGGEGVLQYVPGRAAPVDHAAQIDTWYARTWPKHLHPFPLGDPDRPETCGKSFLIAIQPARNRPWGIYLVDVFDNVVPVLTDPQWDFFEPIPLRPRPVPPTIADRTDRSRTDAVVFLQDVYAGPGLRGVPRGTVKKLRVVAYHYGLPNMAGPDKAGLGGPWEVMRIVGTVPVGADGSVLFRVPANTPLTLQPLDAEGKAVQLMRSWYTAMPGETVSCVGCHEQTRDVPAAGAPPTGRAVEEIRPWYGPARGFDFEREVQPVLDRYCVGCHDGGKKGPPKPDLRNEKLRPDYTGHALARLGATRLHPDLAKHFGGRRVRYTPAYEALLPYVRRVGIEDEVSLLVPGEYHADTSELIQRLRKGHHGVRLDAEAWDRLVTWIDLNAPCHGTWNDVAAVPERTDRRRWELSRKYGGPAEDFEVVADLPRPDTTPVAQQRVASAPPAPKVPGWPFDAAEAKRRQRADGGGETERTVDLGGGVAIRLVRIPAGAFCMGDPYGAPDERAAARVRIDKAFWLGACEVTNAHFRRFDPAHRSGLLTKRYPGFDGPGMSLDGPEQPAVRVSWRQAEAFCRWLGRKTGLRFDLPTEAQWEYACRAGSAEAMSFGGLAGDFSAFANLADRALAVPTSATGGLTTGLTNPHHEKRQPRGRKITGVMEDSLFAGDIPTARRFDDGAVATAPAGRYRPNAWGLHDAHGNAAEWTRSLYRPYPYRADDGRNDPGVPGRRVVRGGSFRDRPARARSGFRLAFPVWQRVHNVGFRVACEDAPASVASRPDSRW